MPGGGPTQETVCIIINEGVALGRVLSAPVNSLWIGEPAVAFGRVFAAPVSRMTVGDARERASGRPRPGMVWERGKEC